MEYYHLQLRDTTPVNKTCKHEIKLCKGLDWFHSIHPSLLPGDLASPIVKSTQEPLKRKYNSCWSEMSDLRRGKKSQTEKDIVGATSIALITSASEDENQAIKKIENIAEKSSLIQAEMKQPEGQNCPESFGSVFQKVSRNLRDQRLGELAVKHQQCQKVPRDGCGDRVMSRKNRGKNVNSVLGTISTTHISNTLSPCGNFPSNSSAENISAGLQKELLSDNKTRKNIQAKLSGFIFKPQKMSSSVHNPNFTAQLQTESYQETDKEKNKRLNQCHSEDGIMRKQTSSISDMGDSRSEVIACFTSEELYKDFFYSDQYKLANKTVDRPMGKDDTENMSQQQRISFPHNTEPTTTGQMKLEKKYLTEVEKNQHQRDDVECLRGDLKDKTKKFLKQGMESSSEVLNYKERQVNIPHSANHNKDVQTVIDFPAHFQNAVGVNKRECFDLGPPPCSVVRSRGTFSGLSLFDSVELGNDVLNTDWDQEFSKTDKI